MENAIDSQTSFECIPFLDKCFDNSFSIRTSLKLVKSLKFELDQETNYFQSRSSQRKKELNRDKSSNLSDFTIVRESQCSQNSVNQSELRAWGLPEDIVNNYEAKGIKRMFKWQVSCLSNSRVLGDYANLVYSAPTSAGKTLVAEILAIKNVLERQKKVIVILPFVSVVREKMFYFQQIFSSTGVRVEGFMGSHAPPGGFSSVHMAICTIEKANNIVNKLMDDGNLSDLGAVIVDEMHLLGDSSRGYILELLLTKLKYISKKDENIHIQIVGMSATLPNLSFLAQWLEAELFVTDFRPIPLEEYCLVDDKIIDKSENISRFVTACSDLGSDGDTILSICLETLREGCSVLIFCTTKNWCESLSQKMASSFYKLGCSQTPSGNLLREQLDTESIKEVLEQLKMCPAGLDAVLKMTVSFGVAYHHAGLTYEERDIIEGAFKKGALRILVSTSTLSSGVNLPARRVIVRSPVFQKQPINILTYKQMIGRAGRMGKDVKGESILVCTEAERKIGLELMNGALDPVKSCIEGDDRFMRAILEVIASETANTKSELLTYTSCTLYVYENNLEKSPKSILNETLVQLVDYELVRTQEKHDDISYIATPLGKACLSSSMAPNDGLSLFCELQKARQCLVLETDLHLIYLVTPYSVSAQWPNMDWLHLLNLWESLPRAMKRVGEMVGVQESFIIRCVRGTVKLKSVQGKIQIHKRFYTALALQDLVNEIPLGEVADKFKCCRGLLQSLQQSSATFAGMVTSFCHQLSWRNLELLVSQFQDRLHFGIQSELIDLMKLQSLNGLRARSLFNAGLESINLLASADVNTVENALHQAVPFQSEKGREGEDIIDVDKRNKIKNIWITGKCGMTAKAAAQSLIQEARRYLQLEIGGSVIKWQHKSEENIALTDNNNSTKSSCDIYSHTHNLQTHSNEVVHKIGSNNLMLETTCESEKTTDNNYKHKILSPKCLSNDVTPEQIDDINNLKEVDYEISIDSKRDKNDSTPSRLSDIFADTHSFSEESSEVNNINEIKYVRKSNEIMTQENEINRISDINSPNEFEESLSVDTQLCHLIDAVHASTTSNFSRKRKIECDLFSLREDDCLNNAFESTFKDKTDIYSTPDLCDGDIVLKYEKEVDTVSNSSMSDAETNIDNISSINSTNIQEITSLQRKTKSRLEKVSTLTKTSNSQFKKIKLSTENMTFWRNCTYIELTSMYLTDLVRQPKNDIVSIACVILGHGDLPDFVNCLASYNSGSIFLEVTEKFVKKPLIGKNIINNCNETKESTDDVVKGISFYLGQDFCFYIDCNILKQLSKTILEKINSWLTNDKVTLSLHCFKSCYSLIKECGLKFHFVNHDTSIMEWLIDSDTIETSICRLVKKYCQRDLLVANERNNPHQHAKKINNKLLSCAQAWGVWHVAKKQIQYLEEQYGSFHKVLGVETHVSKILSESEMAGLLVNKELASRFLVDVKNAQEILQTKANKICGHRLNFSSSKEVAKALGMYNGRKVSTKKSVLSAHNSTLASIITYWRKLNAILTKTLYPLTAKAVLESEDSRIHATYVTYTCTGRVSMQEPNLQNVPRNFTIPARFLTLDNAFHNTEDVMEFNCRNIFLASPGWVLVSADYCQLEMRILTHMCQDKVLVDIMKSDLDVFTSIAASWGCVPVEQVNDDLRQKAKQLCYGIIYGMGNRTLSQQLEVSELEAAVFMDSFHSTYPNVKMYTQKVIAECRLKGYVETLKKRRRYLPMINSVKISEKNAAERQAVNTTIQGSAADIAKAAMCTVDEHLSLCCETENVRLLLQLHDELIYEVANNKKEFFVDILRTAMEQAVNLSIPLPVKTAVHTTQGQNVLFCSGSDATILV